MRLRIEGERGSRLVAGMAAALVGLMAAGTVGATAQAPDLHGLTFATGEAKTFWVHLRAKADLAAAATEPDAAAQGRLVVETLQQTAGQSQAGVVALLLAGKKPFQSFWISNALRVTADAATAATLAQRPEVEGIYPDVEVTLDLPITAAAVPASAPIGSVEWNVRQVNAPVLWDRGITGQGVVVGVLDSGVFFHPALTPHYRGNLGNGLIDHNYNWFDGHQSHSCQGAPCDTIGHGTHVTGTIVGGDGPGPNSLSSPYDIGVAPGAKFISCRAFSQTSTGVGDLLACGEWLLAPTDLFGRHPDPARRPNLINNSWYTPSDVPAFHDMVKAWQAAGILPIFASGNTGPRCGGLSYPAAYPEAFAVGALREDTLDVAPFSGRGPLRATPALIKPDVMAGGENVFSSVTDGGYTFMSGTSMAAPAVSGVAALLLSARPDLKRRPAQAAQRLRDSALPILSSDCSTTTATSPNVVYGWGLADAAQAVGTSPAGEPGKGEERR